MIDFLFNADFGRFKQINYDLFFGLLKPKQNYIK